MLLEIDFIDFIKTNWSINNFNNFKSSFNSDVFLISFNEVV